MSTLKSKGCLFLASSLYDGLEDNNIKQVTTLLLNKEANPNTLIPMYGVTPFHLVIGNDSEAFAEEVTKLFLRHGGNPNVRSVDGLTPVHVAAAWGRVTVLELLLANGGDPLCLDEEGRSPFHYAFDGKYYKAVVILGKYCENTIKEETSTKYKITFDKLLINNGNVIAEYAASENSNIVTESPSKENVFQKYDKQNSTSIQVKYSFDSDGDDSLNSNDQFEANAEEFRIYEETNKEKVLVDKIINQLSNSLKSNFKQQEVNNEYGLVSERNEYDTSPSSTISTDNSMMCNMREKLLLKSKTRRRSITPKHRRKIFKQNNAKISLIPVYNPGDSIISKSPNFLIGEPVGKQRKYVSPKISSQKEMRFKTFTPCMTRNQLFQSEFNLEKEVARSTPRRRKQFHRQYSSLRKLKKNNGLTSSDNTSPDSTNSLSPEHNCIKRLNYKLSKNLAIKLDENKYDDDVLINFNTDENKKNYEKYENENDSIEGLDNNFRNLEIEKTNIVERYEENLKERITSPENFLTAEERSKINSISNSFKENSNTFFSSFKSQSYISVQEEYKHEDIDEGMAFRERRIYTIPPCKSGSTSIDEFWPHLLNLSIEVPLTDQTIRRKLIALGDNPGPITNTTRQLYLKRLTKFENKKNNSSSVRLKSNHCRAFPKTNKNFKFHMQPFLEYGDWVNDLTKYKTIEKNIFEEFCIVSPSRRWREGTNKTCFNYLLLDPRITEDLPSAENMKDSERWLKFLSAIFYIGKGSHNRPFAHLKEASETWFSHKSSDNKKIQRILNIWNEGYGVVCLRVFQNRIPVEAYTREAAMIEALGTENLKNCKSGDYYGKVITWSREEKRKFGRYLLYQAMKIFIHDGERQISTLDF
ncbi:uncharacterized protein LOC114873355 isoform X3 [Osmia bicornis bicornis]|nr:uncharacterized protein LOC114873355 isoform X3 [Osmia bicornis bicornis]